MESQLNPRKNTSKMESQLARYEGTPNRLCDSCAIRCPLLGWRPVMSRKEWARGPRVQWDARRHPDPQCVMCSELMTAVRHRVEHYKYDGKPELEILPCWRAKKKPGGYDWEPCSFISLLPTEDNTQWSSISGCTDSGYLAMIEARDEDQSAPTEAKRALDFDYIQELVSKCALLHGNPCAPTAGPRVPNLRVIDCTTGCVVDAPKDCCYVALSYVWGDQETSAADDGGTMFKPLIRDSIAVTQKLGYRYLWVDRHCIDQDDAYKHVLISRMGDVYSQADITIVVASGTGANDRIPHLDGVNQAVGIIRLEEYIVIPVFRHAACALGKTTWASRAWTYQEAYLSRRRLIFTDDDVFYLCNDVLAAESSKLCIESDNLIVSQQADIWRFIPEPQTKTGYKREIAQTKMLKRQISDYTKRHLTYDSDSLDAFIGVLAESAKTGDRYDRMNQLWGVPHHGAFNYLEIYLDWRHEKGARRRHGFPSWSWCGWAGEASFDKKKHTPSYGHHCLIVLQLDTKERVHLDKFKQNPTKPGEMPQDLLIKTRIVPCELAPGADQVTAPDRPRVVFRVDENTFAWAPVYLDDPQLSPETTYTCIFLESNKIYEIDVIPMLVVKAVDDHYERVGIIYLDSKTEGLSRWYVSNGQRPLHNRFSRPYWLCVQFCDVQYMDGEGKPWEGHFKPGKLHKQPWYRDAEIKEICLR